MTYTLVSISKDYPYTYSIEDENSTEIFYISKSPTSNCQLYSIGNACTFVGLPVNEINDIFKLIYTEIQKTYLLIDVNTHNVKNILKSIDHIIKNVIIKENYISSNGSEMTLLLIEHTSIFD